MANFKQKKRASKEARKKALERFMRGAVWRIRHMLLIWGIWTLLFLNLVSTECSYLDFLRTSVLAVPVAVVFVYLVADWVRDMAWLLIVLIWPQWMLSLMFGGERSVAEYLAFYGVHSPQPIQGGGSCNVCTKYAIQMWLGFIKLLISAHRRNESWGGLFTMEDLRMSGHSCRIKLEPQCEGDFANLLLDLSKLAKLLLVDDFRDAYGDPVEYIKQLYELMTNPPVRAWCSKERQQRFLELLEHHPALKSPFQRIIFISHLFRAYKSMGPAEKQQFDTIVAAMQLVFPDWRLDVSHNPLLYETLVWRSGKPHNTTWRYKVGPTQLFRFLRNFQEHGGDCSANGQQKINHLSQLEYIAAYRYSFFVCDLVMELVLQTGMSGMLEYSWNNYKTA